MRRLTAEEIRDSILAVSGKLNLKMYGPAFLRRFRAKCWPASRCRATAGANRRFEEAVPAQHLRPRQALAADADPRSFDTAETDRSTPVRFITTQPTQALALLNGAFVNKQAGLFADRLRREAGADIDKQVRLALTLATARPPSDGDIRRGVDLIAALHSKRRHQRTCGAAYFCLVVLNLNEFVYLD